MSKTSISIIYVIIAAIILIALVYVYYERQIDAIEQKVVLNPP